MHFTTSSFCLFHLTNGVIFPEFGKKSQPNTSLESVANNKRCVPRKKKQLVKKF